jgi:hypothetical protein
MSSCKREAGGHIWRSYFSGGHVALCAKIQSCEKCWTKFLGFITLFPNSLAVYTKQGEEFRFVLFGRGAWAAAIESQKAVQMSNIAFNPDAPTARRLI